ncbi:MAG: coenzyme F420-0:L-glutamate ligase [Mogibacterium sp.]|nr:coenzyme F420-0:L-glutamate ligase [Mogibacterium sp.]
MEFTANPNKNVSIETSTGTYDRCAIHTHFVEVGEDYNELVERYVKPLWQEGDILAIAEKIVSLCQNNVIPKKDVKVSGLAKFLSRFATQHNSAGIGVGDVYKMQYAIDINGGAKVFFAAVCAGFGKLVGKKGIFYDMVGDEVRGLDGFYPDVFPIYGEFGIPLPKDPVGVCNEIHKKTGIETIIIDANDFTRDILGKCDSVNLTDEQLCEIIRDNPAGQDDQCTPFILIRKK